MFFWPITVMTKIKSNKGGKTATNMMDHGLIDWLSRV